MSEKRLRRLPSWIEADGGLRFACTGCGDCCRGEDAYVWVGDDEIARLVDHVGVGLAAFTRRYVRLVDGEAALVDRPGPGGVCVFWQDGAGCSVYAARPAQCRTFPFWPEHLGARADWEALAGECPGVRAGARPGAADVRLYAPAEVRALAGGRGETASGPGGPSRGAEA